MAVAQETLDRLRTAGLAEVDPDIAELLGQELARQHRRPLYPGFKGYTA